MLRNFSHLDIYLNRLLKDVYAQPVDDGHTSMAIDVFNKWIKHLYGILSVLDAGCGDTAFMQEMFESLGIRYKGIAMMTDNPNVENMDFTFTTFDDDSFDLVFARHSLEHSPMPIITLMEWNRISRHYLCLINPNPDHYGYIGQNHYSVASKDQLLEWCRLAGWKMIWEDDSEKTEIRLLLQKG